MAFPKWESPHHVTRKMASQQENNKHAGNKFLSQIDPDITARQHMENMSKMETGKAILTGNLLMAHAKDNNGDFEKYTKSTWFKVGIIVNKYQEECVNPKPPGMVFEDNRIVIIIPPSSKEEETGPQIVGMAMDEKLNKPLGGELLVIKDEDKRLQGELTHFARLKNEDVLFNQNATNQYAVLTIKELLEELDRMNDNPHTANLRLLDCNIRNTKHEGKKYYRVTFTSPDINSTSRVETIFGHMISGFTYIIKEKVFLKNKDLIMLRVDSIETQYGKKTRWDMGGNVYKKKKNKDKKNED